MGKSLALFAAVASLAMLGAAQAKMVRYEINGQRYSYNTNNRQQVEEARRRIAAANGADAARVKAEAERASNPLATVLGSPTQREAAEALARLKQVMSSSPSAEPAAGLETGGRAVAAERTRQRADATQRGPCQGPSQQTEPGGRAAEAVRSGGDGRKARRTSSANFAARPKPAKKSSGP